MISKEFKMKKTFGVIVIASLIATTQLQFLQRLRLFISLLSYVMKHKHTQIWSTSILPISGSAKLFIPLKRFGFQNALV